MLSRSISLQKHPSNVEACLIALFRTPYSKQLPQERYPMFYNTNVVFRCPAELKDKLKSVAEARDQELSSFIRRACVELLRREAPTFIPPTHPREDNAR